MTPQRAFRGELDEDIGTAEIIELREKFAIAEVRQIKAGAVMAAAKPPLEAAIANS